jgi:hypothetical protein
VLEENASGPTEGQALLRAFSLLDQLSIELEPVELHQAIVLAE